MAVRGLKSSSAGEVTVDSPPGGAPRLDFSRFSSFGLQDDASKSALPRPKSSSHISNPPPKSANADEGDGLLSPGPNLRARSTCDREGLSDLIDFLRSNSPPPQNYLPSAFEDDAEPVEERGRWKSLKRKLRLPRMKSTSGADEGFTKYKVYEPAVSARTSEGYPHMAISIPMDLCHLGPDSDWAVPAVNVTKPLPPSPPSDEKTVVLGTRSKSLSGHGRRGTATRIERGDDGYVTAKSAASTPKLPPKDAQASIRLWQRGVPLSPPQSPPPKTASESTSRDVAGGSEQLSRAQLPMDVNSYVELPASPSSSVPKTPESVEDRMRNVHVSWLKTSQVLQSAPGPPPRSAPHPAPYSSFYSARPRTSPTKPLPRRPDDMGFPVRKSSLRNPGISNIQAQDRPSMDSVLGSQCRRYQLPSTVVEKPEPSPTSQSGMSITSSIVTAESEPVVARARAVRGHSSSSIVLQSTPGTTPRASLILLSPEKYSQPAAEGTPISVKTQRKASTRMNAARKNRAERVKSLKQRDMQAARARMSKLHEMEHANHEEWEPRPRTASTVISTLRLPSRDGVQGTPSVSSFAEFFPRPPTADDARSSYRRDSGLLHASRSRNYCSETGAEHDFGHLAPVASSNRESFCSSRGARRHDSYQRTSWASSIPLLDRIGSYAPSETSFMEILDSASPASNLHRRSDSATLPRIEQERLAPSRLSLVPSVNMDNHRESGNSSQRQSIQGTVGLCINSDTSTHWSSTHPRPCTPPEERWSATTIHAPESPTTISSPTTSVTTSLRANGLSEEPTPPASRRGSPDKTEAYGRAMVPSSDVSLQLLQHRVQCAEDRSVPHQVGYLHHGIWAPAGAHDAVVPCSHSSQGESTMQRRGSRALLRMTSSELRAHYASLHRLDRASTMAHQMLLNQERLELDMRRNEHNQMVFFNRIEQALENMGQCQLPSNIPNSSLGWEEYEGIRSPGFDLASAPAGRAGDQNSKSEERHGRFLIDESAGTEPGFRLSRQERPRTDDTYSPTDSNGELEAMDPLMRELATASRVSLEDTTEQQDGGISGQKDSPAGIGGREMDALFNMI